MAKIHEEILIIKLSTLVKNGTSRDSLINEEMLDALTSVTEELTGPGVVVEVEKANVDSL